MRALAVALLLAGAAVWLAVTNLMESADRSRQKRTMADMRSISMAWEARANDRKSYGNGRMHAAELARLLQPTYIRKMPQRDGWGHEFEFRANDVSQSYAIRSFGSDGKQDSGAAGAFEVSDYHRDLIFGNGVFVQYPEGI